MRGAAIKGRGHMCEGATPIGHARLATVIYQPEAPSMAREMDENRKCQIRKIGGTNQALQAVQLENVKKKEPGAKPKSFNTQKRQSENARPRIGPEKAV